MQNHKLIQNTNIFPDTHFFLYKNKKYPFKFDFFKYSSKYFENNLKEIEKSNCILLFDSESEKELDISDDTIYNFINFIQGQQISLTNENVINLNYLANIYDVPTLKELSYEYIDEHHQELVINVLSSEKYALTIDTKSYENALSEHLSDYIDDERLSDLEVSTIYRVLHKNENQNKIEKQKLFDFLFRCLDRHGKEASVLFSDVDFSEFGTKYVNRLLSDYSNVFDFHYLGSSVVQAMYNEESSLISKIIVCENKEKEQEEEIKDLKESVNEIKNELNRANEDKERQILEFQRKEEQNEKRRKEQEEAIKNLEEKVNEINRTNEDKERQILEFQKKEEQNEKRRKEQEETIKNLEEKVNEINRTNEEKDKLISEFKKREEQNKKEQNEALNTITQEMNELRNMLNQLKFEQKKKEEELKEKYENDIQSIGDKLKSEINQQQSEIIAKEDEINELRNELHKFKEEYQNVNNSISSKKDINFDELFNLMIPKTFNKMTGESQISLINEIKIRNNSELIDQIANFLSFLSNYNQQKMKRYFFFEKQTIPLNNSQQNEKENLIIGISHNITQILYDNGKLKSTELENIISLFPQFIIEICYPSPNFDDIYLKVLDLKNKFKNILNIKIFITGIDSTNKKFIKNHDINFVELDFGIKYIQKSFFACKSLKQITIPSSIISIKNNAFEECSSLSTITIPPSVTEIGNDAFRRCKSLVKIDIQASLKTIKKATFGGCSSLTQIDIPSSVESIESYAFIGCESLKQIKIPPSVTEIGNYAFQRCELLSNIDIPPLVSIIKEYSFSICSTLTIIKIPSSVIEIEKEAFWKCSSLKEVVFEAPSSLKSIEYCAFSNCTSLEQISIPSSVTKIDNTIFENCQSLKKVSIPSSINISNLNIGPNVNIILI